MIPAFKGCRYINGIVHNKTPKHGSQRKQPAQNGSENGSLQGSDIMHHNPALHRLCQHANPLNPAIVLPKEKKRLLQSAADSGRKLGGIRDNHRCHNAGVRHQSSIHTLPDKRFLQQYSLTGKLFQNIVHKNIRFYQRFPLSLIQIGAGNTIRILPDIVYIYLTHCLILLFRNQNDIFHKITAAHKQRARQNCRRKYPYFSQKKKYEQLKIHRLICKTALPHIANLSAFPTFAYLPDTAPLPAHSLCFHIPPSLFSGR